MIPSREILELRDEWRLRSDVIEKDYTLGWMLAAIAANAELENSWVFKGGTCLRKCYYGTYRFSEDLDFTVIEGGPEEPAELVRIFDDIATWLYDHSGIQLEVDDRASVVSKTVADTRRQSAGSAFAALRRRRPRRR